MLQGLEKFCCLGRKTGWAGGARGGFYRREKGWMKKIFLLQEKGADHTPLNQVAASRILRIKREA